MTNPVPSSLADYGLNREYQLTYVTYVIGDLALDGYFNLPSGSNQPQVIMTTENKTLDFTRLKFFIFTFSLFIDVCALASFYVQLMTRWAIPEIFTKFFLAIF